MKTKLKVSAIAGMAALAITTILAGSPASAAPAESSNPSEAIQSFPLRHMSISFASDAGGGERPEGTVWVGVGDGTAMGPIHERAVPMGESFSVDPDQCDSTGPCIWSWVQAGDEVRVFARWQGQSCVLIGSMEKGERTRINCGGVSQVI